ncbi:MAG TPA: hypothetical protein DGG94_23445 [Micromonosporaceae bacterium]|nr:hypothetical protein [Micromonosporaceae bacterium]
MSHRSLTHAEAIARAAVVRKLAYELDVDLTGGPDTFRTVTTVRFAADEGDATFPPGLEFRRGLFRSV